MGGLGRGGAALGWMAKRAAQNEKAINALLALAPSHSASGLVTAPSPLRASRPKMAEGEGTMMRADDGSNQNFKTTRYEIENGVGPFANPIELFAAY